MTLVYRDSISYYEVLMYHSLSEYILTDINQYIDGFMPFLIFYISHDDKKKCITLVPFLYNLFQMKLHKSRH